jgi:hypothetical protein
MAELGGGRGLDAVNLEIGAGGELLEIEDQAAVERRVAGDRERGQGGAVKQRQGQDVVVGKGPDRPLLHPLHQPLEPLPVGLVRRPEAAGVDHHRPGFDEGRGLGAHSRFLLLRSI